MSLRDGVKLRSVVLALLLLGGRLGVPMDAMACACDEICHPGEAYSDVHEMCVDGDKLDEEATEKATS